MWTVLRVAVDAEAHDVDPSGCGHGGFGSTGGHGSGDVVSEEMINMYFEV